MSLRIPGCYAALVAGVMFATAPASADQVCLKAHGPKTRITDTLQSSGGFFVQGQRGDLTFDIISASWLTTPCPTGEKRVVTGLKVKAEVRWLVARAWNGGLMSQSEAPEDVAGPDFFTIQWQAKNRYALVSMTRDANSVDLMAGASPEATCGSGGGWDGVRVTLPDGFESARTKATRRVKYVMKFTYTPEPADDCTVVALNYKGSYMHSYRGDYHYWSGDSVSISLGFPWSVSVGGSISGTSEHCWVRQLVEPTGRTHVATWDPPVNGVSRATCCDAPTGSADTTPPATSGLTGLPASATRGALVSATTTASDTESGVAAVDYLVLTPDGAEVAADRIEFDPPCPAGCDANFQFSVPADLTSSELLVSAFASDSAGNISLDEQDLAVTDPLSNPHVSSAAGLQEDRIVAPDDLFIDVFETAGTLASDVAGRTVVNVYTPGGLLRDAEDAPQFIDQGGAAFRATFPVAVAQVGTANDGALSVLNGDLIHVVYRDDSDPNLAVVTRVATDPNAVYPPLNDQPEPGCTKFTGLSYGDDVVFAVDGEYIALTTTPNETGASIASRLVEAINDAALPSVVAFFTPPNEVQTAGAEQIYPVNIDPGIILKACAYCPGDLDGNLVVDLADLALMLSVFGVDAADSNYAFDADIDTNTRIELDDLAGLLAVFGTTCEN